VVEDVGEEGATEVAQRVVGLREGVRVATPKRDLQVQPAAVAVAEGLWHERREQAVDRGELLDRLRVRARDLLLARP
jgi:hypothetical protein